PRAARPTPGGRKPLWTPAGVRPPVWGGLDGQTAAKRIHRNACAIKRRPRVAPTRRAQAAEIDWFRPDDLDLNRGLRHAPAGSIRVFEYEISTRRAVGPMTTGQLLGAPTLRPLNRVHRTPSDCLCVRISHLRAKACEASRSLQTEKWPVP